MSERHNDGFTLVELMITVAIVGIISSIAMPQFARYKYRTKYSEATANLAEMYRGEATFYNSTTLGENSESFSGAAGAGACFCPAVGGIPRTPTEEPYVADCTGLSTCNSIGFNPSDPIYFSYTAWYGWKGWQHVNVAMEDLDGDTDIGALVEVIGVRDGELYRAGRYTYGDQDTIFNVVLQTFADLPTAPSN